MWDSDAHGENKDVSVKLSDIIIQNYSVEMFMCLVCKSDIGNCRCS